MVGSMKGSSFGHCGDDGCCSACLRANSLTFQNVTFEMLAVDSNTFSLSISNALNANGDWTGIESVASFEVKTLGSVSSLTLTDWTNTDKIGRAHV